MHLVPIRLFYKSDDLCGGVSVASKPDKHSAREDVSEKYGNDQASLDLLNIVKDYVAGLMVQRRLRDTLTETTLIEE